MAKRTLIIYPGFLFNVSSHEARRWKQEETFSPSLHVLYSYLKQHNIEVDVLDFCREVGRPSNSAEREAFRIQAKNLLQKYNFDIVAISCFTTFDYISTIMVAEFCKELNPNCKIVVGGVHPTAVPQDFMEGGLFDFIVKGEGEIALLDICRGRYDHKSGPQVIEGSPLDFSQGIYLDWENYKYVFPGMSKGYLSLSRGCPFKCNFCSESTRPVERREYPVGFAVRDIMRAAEINNPKMLFIQDPLFRVDSPWGREILEVLVQRNFKKPFFLFARVDLLREEHIDLLSKLNVILWLGIDSGSEKILTIMQKTTNPKKYLEKVAENLTFLNERDVVCSCSLIFNHPGETPETVDETFSFLERFASRQKTISVDFMAKHYFHLPGTLLSENLERFEREFGTVIKHKTWWKEHSDHQILCRDNIPSRGLTARINYVPRFYTFWENNIRPKISRNTLLFRCWESGVTHQASKVFEPEETNYGYDFEYELEEF